MTWFALATYRSPTGSDAPAVVVADRMYDLHAALAAGACPGAPSEWRDGGVRAMVEQWTAHRDAVRKLGADVAELAKAGKLAALPPQAKLAPPVRPARIFCAAANYIEHANEMGTVLAAKSESKPYMFLKLEDTVVGHGDTVIMPPETQKLDWEVELGAVIGRTARRIGVGEALDYVAGYTIVNDISARDLNVRSDYPFKFDWFQGKCWDTFAPLGPWIVPAWLVPDPQAVHMKLSVNGNVMQDDTTRHMIWTVREQVSYLSQILTLRPGDVIATGTPTGVGMARGVFLKDGDAVEATIDGIGTLANRIAAEKR